MNETAIVALRVSIRGKVQGVGFRESMRMEADQLRVTGWVRNRHDGSVEALIQGSTQSVETLLQWAHIGPVGAKVLRIETKEEPAQDYTQFSRWPTA